MDTSKNADYVPVQIYFPPFSTRLFPQGSSWALWTLHQLILLLFDIWLGLANGKQNQEFGRQEQREIGVLISQASVGLGLGAAVCPTKAPIWRTSPMAAALQILVTILPLPSSGWCGNGSWVLCRPFLVSLALSTPLQIISINSCQCVSSVVHPFPIRTPTGTIREWL